MNRYKKSLVITGLLAGSMLASCSIPRKTVFQNPQVIPRQFAADTSSLIVAPPGREQFFKDPQLNILIRDVLQRNPDMHIALQRIRTAGAWLKMSKGALLPSLQVNAGAGATRYGKHTMEGVGNFDTNLSPNIDEDQKVNTNPVPDFLLGLSTSWEADIWGKLSKLKKAARLRWLASQQGADWVKSMLVAQTAGLYYELIALDKETGIIGKNIRLQQRALEVVEAQKAGGRASELAVQQFKAQLLNTQSASYAIKQRLLETQHHLNVLAGRYTGEIERNSDLTFDNHFDDHTSTGIPAGMLINRADIKQAHAELEAARADVAAARAAFFPGLNLSAYTALSSFKGSLLFSATAFGYQVLGGLTAPVFQKHQLKAQFRIAGASQEQAFYNYEKTVLNAYREVLNQMNALVNTRQMFLLKEEEVAALEQGVSISNDLYVTGYASYLEIIAAQKSKLDAELQLINLQRNRIYSNIELYRSLGGGWN